MTGWFLSGNSCSGKEIAFMYFLHKEQPEPGQVYFYDFQQVPASQRK